MSSVALNGLPQCWRAVFKRNIESLTAALKVGLLPTSTPQPSLIFEAFRLTPLDNVRVVLLGQDPYPGGEATGLSFSVSPPTPLPPSLQNINLALQRSGLSHGPTNGCLKSWAAQGVLLLNSALTTRLGQSDVHANEWRPFITAIMAECASRNAIFILLGKKAQGVFSSANITARCLTEKHPSPLANQSRVGHFGDSKIFLEVNRQLAVPIDWNIGSGIVAPAHNIQANRITYYTDGGARANGKPECQSSWGLCCVISGAMTISQSGLVEGKLQSNNRGELTGILNALKLAAEDIGANPNATVEIVSDSEYSIKSMSIWGATPTTTTGKPRENYDLVSEGYKIYTSLKPQIVFRHVRGHQDPPSDNTTQQYADWYYNDIVDKLCQNVF